MPWRDYVLNRFWLKLVSVGLASLIWFTIRSSTETTNLAKRRFPHIPVSVLIVAAETRAFKVDPAEVELTVSGEQVRLRELSGQDLEAFVNLTDVPRPAGLVKRIEVHTPPGITLVQVYPPTVRVEPAAPAGNVTNTKSLSP